MILCVHHWVSLIGQLFVLGQVTSSHMGVDERKGVLETDIHQPYT